MHQCDDNEGVYGDWKKDLYESIQNATKFIYLAIPSFNPNVVLLLNETKNKKSATVGEMLHEKYQKGIYNTFYDYSQLCKSSNILYHSNNLLTQI